MDVEPNGSGAPMFEDGTWVKRAIDQARPRKSGKIEARHFLLALLACERPDPAAELLHELGLDPAVVRDRLTN